VAPDRVTQPGKPHLAPGLETHVLSQQIETWLPFKTLRLYPIDLNYTESTPKLFTKTHHNTMTTSNNNNNNNNNNNKLG